MQAHEIQRTAKHTLTDRSARALAALVSAAAWTVACDQEPGVESEAAATAIASPVAELALDAAPEPVAGMLPVCPADRVIAVNTEGACDPQISGTGGTWLGGSLLAGELLDGTLPPALQGLCEYTWSSKVKAPPDLDAFGSPYEGAASDCEVNWPQGQLLDDALRTPLRDVFYQHLGRLAPQDLPTAPRAPVTVALADTASRANVEMNSDHARSMWRIIESIACPKGQAGCPVELSRHLALPLVEGGVIDAVHGGFYGGRAHLARAIFAAVQRWKHTPNSGPLVLNLSLGWEPTQFGGSEPSASMPGPARAVLRTLQYAVCESALVIAAAGNQAGDECSSGALAPAIWEDRLGPAVTACQNQFGAGNPPVDVASRPLVHAVGGLAYDDGPLPNALPGGRPRLAAPAFMAVADDPQTGLTTPLTGSSVATAAVSGIAALVWSYRPGLTPGEVITQIYSSGTQLPAQAEFGVGGAIRRANACSALQRGCKGASCPAACTSAKADVSLIATAADDIIATLENNDQITSYDATAVDAMTECPAMCSTAEVWTDGQGSACAQDVVGEATRYTNPQPRWPTCSVCFISDETLYMEIDADAPSMYVHGVVLEVWNGATSQRHVLKEPPTPVDNVTAIELAADNLVEPIDYAVLHVTHADGFTRTNAIPVL